MNNDKILPEANRDPGIDGLLVSKAQGGDRQAFDALVLKYQNRVIKLVGRYVYDHSEALDVAQEVFIKAYRSLKGFRGDSAFYTWLHRIAINTAKNYLLSLGRRPPSSDIDASEAEQFIAAEGLKETETPEGILLREEIQQTVFAAIADLPAELRTAIELRELQGLSYDEIAQQMGCPIGTVRSRIFRARDAIESRLRSLLP